jgi:hypothetical protein
MVVITQKPLSETQTQLTPLEELGQRVTELTLENLRLQQSIEALGADKEDN